MLFNVLVLTEESLLTLTLLLYCDSTFPLARSGASVFSSFLLKLSLNACMVHYGIECSAEKAVRATKSIKKIGHISICKYRAKNAGILMYLSVWAVSIG